MEWIKNNIVNILVLVTVGVVAYLFNQSFSDLSEEVGTTQNQLSEVKIVVDDNNKRIQDLEKDAESIQEDVENIKDDINKLQKRSPF